MHSLILVCLSPSLLCLHPLPPPTSTPHRWFFQQLIIGLDYCHKMGVVNRDIKLENTLLQVSDERRRTVP